MNVATFGQPSISAGEVCWDGCALLCQPQHGSGGLSPSDIAQYLSSIAQVFPFADGPASRHFAPKLPPPVFERSGGVQVKLPGERIPMHLGFIIQFEQRL